MKRMIEKLKENKTTIICGAVCTVVGLIGGFIFGHHKGEDDFIEEVIHLYENGDDNMVFTSDDPELGDLMYEIKAECIGD